VLIRIARHVVAIALASASAEDVVAAVAPTLQRHLTETSGLTPTSHRPERLGRRHPRRPGRVHPGDG
jgi:hypothetical protein